MRSLAMLAIAAISGAAMAQFTEGNLVVSVIGDGGETANNQPVFLREFTTAGASVGSDLSLTNIGGRHVTTTYGETSEAQLVRSGNGMYLTIPGYDLEPHNLTTFSVYDTPRVVARINNAKVVGFSTNFSIYDPITFKGDGVRCAYSSTGDDYLVTGGDGGIMKGTSFATNPTHYFAGDYSSRTITRWGGQVYYNGSNAYFGGNGLATWDETPNFPVPIFAAAGSSRDFEVYSPTVIYVAHSTNAVGLVKYVFDGSNWNEAYRVGGAGLNSIAADFSGSQPTFYVTSSNGENLFKIVDLGTAFSSRETIAVAAAGT
ncbi:MAG TPA: hypothetical protein PKA27_12580, partial [Fimbriimonadaceae bacterium]|nr:hypothetical protein [Fimbriimonadaceae bacterium]